MTAQLGYNPQAIDLLLDNPNQTMALSREFYFSLDSIEKRFQEIPLLAERCLVAKDAYRARLLKYELPFYSPKRVYSHMKMLTNELKDAKPETLYEIIGNCIVSLEQNVSLLLPSASLSLQETRKAKDSISECIALAYRHLPSVEQEERAKTCDYNRSQLVRFTDMADLRVHERALMHRQETIRDLQVKKNRLRNYIQTREEQLNRLKPLEAVQEQIISVMTLVRDSLGLEYEWLEQNRLGYSIADHMARYGKHYASTLNSIRQASAALDDVPRSAIKALEGLRGLIR